MRLSDAEYLLRQDIKDKKSAGRGVFHKKGGSKSKKCTLPHERLTKKELEKMNGEVESYNPKAWYTYEEFKKLPMKFQVEYVNSLITRYNCSCAGICQYVFGICRTALSNHFRKAGQLEFINNRDAHWRITAAGDQKLKEDVEAARAIQNGSNIDDIEEAKEDEPYESPQSQINKSIADAIDTVTLYASNGVPMPPEKIDEIFMEKCGMTRAEAEKASGLTWENAEEPVEEIEDAEDSTDVSSFSIVMSKLDMGIIEYIRNLFAGKKYVVNLEVKEIKE